MAVNQNQPTPQVVPDPGLAFAVYVLYCAGYVTVLSAIAGVIIAHVNVKEADPMLASHFQFQIRTFWIGLLYIVGGIVLSFIVIGVFVLLWWFVWSMVRIIKGMLALNDGRPIPDPQSWLFG